MREVEEEFKLINAWHRFIENVKLRRFCVLALVIFILWLARSMMSVVLLTFIFTFLITHLVRFIHKVVRIPSIIVVLVTYAVVLAALYFGITNYLPKLITQVGKMITSVIAFYQNPDSNTNELFKFVNSYISTSNIMEQLRKGVSLAFTYITTIGSMGATFVMSLILSFFYTSELRQMKSFSNLFLDSDFGWFFQDLAFFGRKFVNTFGVVLEAQFFIAICNTVITTVILIFMGMPQIMALAIMIFILSLIPVAGVIVSCIPLSIIGYSIGGIRDVIYILVMIAIVHVLEAYVLNPKFMSSRTELPVFYTFVVLLVSEHLFGVWGLIVGVPIFTFLLDILGVKSIRGAKRKWQRPHSDIKPEN